MRSLEISNANIQSNFWYILWVFGWFLQVKFSSSTSSFSQTFDEPWFECEFWLPLINIRVIVKAMKQIEIIETMCKHIIMVKCNTRTETSNKENSAFPSRSSLTFLRRTLLLKIVCNSKWMKKTYTLHTNNSWSKLSRTLNLSCFLMLCLMTSKWFIHVHRSCSNK